MANSHVQHWGLFAATWGQLGSPLRPSPADQQGYGTFVFPWIEQFSCPRILILGVTPELYHLPWPAKRDLIALDRAREMIDIVWPGPRSDAIEGDWLEMPDTFRKTDDKLLKVGIRRFRPQRGQDHRALQAGAALPHRWFVYGIDRHRTWSLVRRDRSPIITSIQPHARPQTRARAAAITHRQSPRD